MTWTPSAHPNTAAPPVGKPAASSQKGACVMTLRMHDRQLPTRHKVEPQLRSPANPAIRLTWFVTALVASAAVTGLLAQAIYTGDESTAAMLRGYDLVTALVVVPGLVTVAHRASRGSVVAHVFLMS